MVVLQEGPGGLPFTDLQVGEIPDHGHAVRGADQVPAEAQKNREWEAQ